MDATGQRTFYRVAVVCGPGPINFTSEGVAFRQHPHVVTSESVQRKLFSIANRTVTRSTYGGGVAGIFYGEATVGGASSAIAWDYVRSAADSYRRSIRAPTVPPPADYLASPTF